MLDIIFSITSQIEVLNVYSYSRLASNKINSAFKIIDVISSIQIHLRFEMSSKAISFQISKIHKRFSWFIIKQFNFSRISFNILYLTVVFHIL